MLKNHMTGTGLKAVCEEHSRLAVPSLDTLSAVSLWRPQHLFYMVSTRHTCHLHPKSAFIMFLLYFFTVFTLTLF